MNLLSKPKTNSMQNLLTDSSILPDRFNASFEDKIKLFNQTLESHKAQLILIDDLVDLIVLAALINPENMRRDGSVVIISNLNKDTCKPYTNAIRKLYSVSFVN